MVPFLNFRLWSQIQLLFFPPLLCRSCCSVAKSCLTVCDPVDYSKPGSSVLHCLPEFAQIPVHWGGDDIQPSHPLLPCSKLWWCGHINTQMFHSGHWWEIECYLHLKKKKNGVILHIFYKILSLKQHPQKALRKEGERQTKTERFFFFNRRLLSPNLPVWHTQSCLNDIVLKHLST